MIVLFGGLGTGIVIGWIGGHLLTMVIRRSREKRLLKGMFQRLSNPDIVYHFHS